MDKAGVLTEKQKVWDGRDLFFPLSMRRPYGNESMGCHRCANFHSGQLPICGTESKIDAASACWINRAEFALVQFHTCQVVKSKCQERTGEVWRRVVTEVVLHHMFYIFLQSDQTPSIYFLSATIPNKGHEGYSGFPVVGKRQEYTLLSSPIQHRTYASFNYMFTQNL